MANPTWPAGLPEPLADGSARYALLVDNVISSSVETGAPKYRRRFTNVPLSFTCKLNLTGAQCNTLDAFVATTLKDVGQFDWLDFRDRSAATYVFTKRPEYAQRSERVDAWAATLELLKVA